MFPGGKGDLREGTRGQGARCARDLLDGPLSDGTARSPDVGAGRLTELSGGVDETDTMRDG